MMSLSRYFFAFPLSLMCVFTISRAQTMPSGNATLPLRGALVLTPDFCATQMRPLNSRGRIAIGAITCSELEAALKGVFSSLSRVTSPSSIGEAQVVLVPAFNTKTTTSDEPWPLAKGFGRDIVTVLQWNVKDVSGKIVCVEVAEGRASKKFIRSNKEETALVAAAVQAAAEQSAAKIAGAPELRKLTEVVQLSQHVSEMPPVNTSATSQSALPPNVSAGDYLDRYALEYVHSDQKWKHNLRTDSYDDIAEIFQDQMAAVLERKGLHRATPSDRVCCKLILEILSVKTVNNSLGSHLNPHNPLKEPKESGVDVAGRVKLADGSGNLVYSSEYRGESLLGGRTMESERTMMHEAIADMVKSISIDESFVKALNASLNAGAK